MHHFMKKMKDSKEHEWWNAYKGFFSELFKLLKYLWKSQQAISKFCFLKTEQSPNSKNDIL